MRTFRRGFAVGQSGHRHTPTPLDILSTNPKRGTKISLCDWGRDDDMRGT